MMLFLNIIAAVCLSLISFWAGYEGRLWYPKLCSLYHRNVGNTEASVREKAEFGTIIDEKQIFDNLKKYFETDRPYLNPDLVIKDVAREIYTNRSYLSKSIRTFDGGNFCSFVNKYRVRYSLELYHNDMTLRVSELARLSGFNSPTAFNIAFKAEMNITPGEWCRRCRLTSMKAIPPDSCTKRGKNGSRADSGPKWK